ncbi:MAG: enoyl-CoA hydratase/isomerase family protein [Aliihoeflea sp.]|uniref:enoyl-CoA hydratase/isomerase family protein n=1 Tax=Aliihoeflea sp. TaxID=2608088 RepID=UPI0040348FC5
MSDFPAYETIRTMRRGRILTLTLNRPDKLNAVDEKMHGELATIFRAAADDPHSDVIILTGAGRAFSAGGDIVWMQKMIDEGFDQTAREAKRIVLDLLDCDKPIIAKLNGHAAGFGATMALFCDVIFAADHAKIGDPHVAVGLTAGDGGALIWPQLIGYARAKRYLLTGDMIAAAEAERIGLITHALPAADLDGAVDAFADRLASAAQVAIRTTKRAIHAALKANAAQMMDTCLALEAISNASTDHQEAVNAFRDSRAPVFTGR